MDRSDINNEQHTLSLNHSQLATQTLFKSLPRFVDGTQDHDFNSARFRMEGARDDKKSLMLPCAMFPCPKQKPGCQLVWG